MSFLLTCAIAALIPLLIGFIWYHPKAFGKTWMAGAGLTEESAKTMNMPLVFGLTYVFSFFIAFSMHGITIHQFDIYGLLEPEMGYTDPEGAIKSLQDILKVFENKFRTFRHGMVHGAFTSVLFILPIIAIDSMFGRKNWKYILINAGYWIVSLVIMGGVVCQFSGR